MYDLTQFDADAIMHSGQVFRYFETSDGYEITAGENIAHLRYIELNGKRICEIKSNDSGFFYNYFDFDTDYGSIKRDLLRHDCLVPAIMDGGGIRILRAPFVEMVVSFIISANNNIKRFTKTLNLLCERFGSPLGNGRFAFPTLDELCKIEAETFRELGCGYRGPYLVRAIEQLGRMDFADLEKLSDGDLYKELTALAGVGDKVVRCIMLFAFHRLNIAPVDTWIKKAIADLGCDQPIEEMFAPWAGVAQQYIFYYMQYLGKAINQIQVSN